MESAGDDEGENSRVEEDTGGPTTEEVQPELREMPGDEEKGAGKQQGNAVHKIRARPKESSKVKEKRMSGKHTPIKGKQSPE